MRMDGWRTGDEDVRKRKIMSLETTLLSMTTMTYSTKMYSTMTSTRIKTTEWIMKSATWTLVERVYQLDGGT